MPVQEAYLIAPGGEEIDDTDDRMVLVKPSKYVQTLSVNSPVNRRGDYFGKFLRHRKLI